MPTIDAIGPHTAAFLVSQAGRAACATLADANLDITHTQSLLTRLRRDLTPEQAGAVLALARLRRRAAAKFPAADRLFFTAEALEQSTAWQVACQHARWLDQHAPPGAVLDLGCGIGGDLLAFAQYRHVLAYELDPVRALFARENAAALGLGDKVEVHQGDWVPLLRSGLPPGVTAAFADPARRVADRRVFHLEQLQPPFSTLLSLQAQLSVLGVKVMPGVSAAELPPAAGVEFISHERTCKEAVLWFGPAAWRPRWATILLDTDTIQFESDATPPPFGTLEPGQVLFEPDPALIRAGCLDRLCQRYDAHLFDPQIAYLVGPTPVHDALAQVFRIEEVHPFSVKLLNQRLQALGVSQVELKKRGFPAEPETLRPQLKLAKTGRAATILFTRRGEDRLMILAHRLTSAIP